MSILASLKIWIFWMLLFIRRIFVVSGFFGLMAYPISFDWASLLVRVATGLALLPWGLKKIAKFKSMGKDQPPKIFAVGPLSARVGFISVMLIETVVPVCLILGLCTRLIVIPCIFSMAVAFKVTRGEYCTSPASIYFLLMIAILFIGSGAYSLDYLFMHVI